MMILELRFRRLDDVAHDFLDLLPHLHVLASKLGKGSGGVIERTLRLLCNALQLVFVESSMTSKISLCIVEVF